MTAKRVALGMALVCAAYFALLGWRAWLLLTSGSAAGAALGAGVLLVPLLCGWAVTRELLFGRHTEVLARQLETEGGLPVDDLPRTSSGRVDRAAATTAFDRYRAETESTPDDWRSWFRLGCAYDVAGDRSRARAAMRHAVQLHRAR